MISREGVGRFLRRRELDSNTDQRPEGTARSFAKFLEESSRREKTLAKKVSLTVSVLTIRMASCVLRVNKCKRKGHDG